MTDTTTQETPTETNTTTTTEQQPVQLHVNDIVNGTILLKVAIERGVFKAEEIAEVGQVFSKLNAFVQYIQAVAQKESQAAAEKTAETPTEKPKHKKSKK